MLNIIQSTAAYERWLGVIVEPVAEDTRLKHEVMRKDAFTFFRATFYCWARLWQRLPEPPTAARACRPAAFKHPWWRTRW